MEFSDDAKQRFIIARQLIDALKAASGVEEGWNAFTFDFDKNNKSPFLLKVCRVVEKKIPFKGTVSIPRGHLFTFKFTDPVKRVEVSIVDDGLKKNLSLYEAVEWNKILDGWSVKII